MYAIVASRRCEGTPAGRRPNALTLLVVVLAISTTAPWSALAQRGSARGASEADDEAGRYLFNSAREAFESGDYATALERFEHAYKLSQRPQLLYNIGTALDRLRRNADALAAFEQYLELVPEASNRDEVSARVTVLRQAVEDENRAREERDRIEAERSAAAEEARRAREERDRTLELQAKSSGLSPPIFYTTAGAAVAALGAGVALNLLTVSRNDAYVDFATTPGREINDENHREAERLYNRAIATRRGAIAMYGVSGGLALGAGLLLIWTQFGSRDDSSASAFRRLEPDFAVGPGGANLGFTHRF